MTFIAAEEEKSLKITITDVFNIYHVNTARALILDKLKDKEDMSIDCSSLEEIDSSGIQLLLSIVKTAASHGVSLNIKGNKIFSLYLKQTGNNVSEFLFKGENVEKSSDC